MQLSEEEHADKLMEGMSNEEIATMGWMFVIAANITSNRNVNGVAEVIKEMSLAFREPRVMDQATWKAMLQGWAQKMSDLPEP